ncbi:MAG TPA: sugar ABC transporter permease [Candidatus Limiplasma sp.]|nr:sugar ABC transporter permease [Candidatus Limiplasma sp.]HRX08587.1 sugar ABC transporter permease [Candidatus Limiplasma sp.]
MQEKSLLRRSGIFLAFNGVTLFAFTAVLIIPFLYGLFLTFTDWNAISDTFSFVGFQNYAKVFSDKEFLRQFLITFKYVIISALLCNLLAFTLAYFLTSGIRAQNFLRGGFFIPNLIGGIILGYIWKFIFANVLTQVGKAFNIAWLQTSFLTNPDRAIWAMIIVTVWQYAGYLMMIYIAGFVGIPRDVQEAADIDGAHGLRKLWRVTIPMMIPSFNICMFITMSRGFMAYDLNLSLTNGGPYGSTRLAAMHVYQKAFQSKLYGIGQSEAIVLFVVVAILSVTQLLINKKREVEV